MMAESIVYPMLSDQIMTKHTRRQFFSLAVPAAMATTIGLSDASALEPEISDLPGKRLKIIAVGAHPDDPETICGGLMALYSGLGHEVVSVYLTRGEAGIEGKSYEEAAKIRTSEALKACDILKVRPVFLEQIDGNCEITSKSYTPLFDLFTKEKPDIILTHWPVDTHRDHRICSLLVYDAWLYLGRRSALYYCEAMSGTQSQNFTPTDYLDITSVIELKHKACFAHVSQQIKETYEEHHGNMERFRGMEFRCEYAEAFVRHRNSPGIYLL